MQKLETENRVIGNLPPEDIIAEEAIIGGVFIDSQAMDRIGEALEAKDFYSEAGKKIYQAILDVHETGAHPDLVTVASRLKALGWLHDIGGEQRLYQMRDRVMNAENVADYAELIHEKAKRRELISYSATVSQLAHQTEKPLSEVLDEVESSAFKVTQSTGQKSAASLGEVASDVGKEILERHNSQVTPGYKTGFYDFDAMTQGLQKGDLSIWGARPAMGKTSAAVQIGKNIAEDSGMPVIVFSLEMSKEQLTYRILSTETKIESGRLRIGRIAQHEWEPLGHAIEGFQESPLKIIDIPGIKVGDIRSQTRKVMATHGQPACIIIDYLQIMGGVDDGNLSSSIGKITRQLKTLARELDIHVLLLSQLSRDVESRTNKRPMMSDLRNSGAIEQDADLIVMLYREDYYDPETPDRGVAEWIITKHRSGPTGTVKLLFQPEFTQFLNRAKDTGYQPPAPKKTMRPEFSNGGDRYAN